MDSFPVEFCRNIRMSWRRRRYQRIEGSPGRRKNLMRTAKLGSGAVAAGGSGGAMRRAWRVRRALRLPVKLWSPTRLLARLRDAYINAMLGLRGKAGGRSGVAGPDVLWAKRVPKARPGDPAPLDFDTRVLVEIYKSFLAPREWAAL